MFTFKHYKYIYSADQSPVEVFNNMIQNINADVPQTEIKKNIQYLKNRSNLMKIMKAVNARLFFNSNTYFSAVYFMDYICSKNMKIEKLKDFLVISLSCLIVSAKFNETDSHFPEMKDFISLLSVLTQYKYRVSLEDLFRGEIFVLKSLHYKLERYPIYLFIVFFFAHGVLLGNNENYDLLRREESSIQKILEKVYSVSREILERFLEENPFCLGSNCYLAAISILKKAISIATSQNNCFINSIDVFRTIYGITELDSIKYSKIDNFVNHIYTCINKDKIKRSQNKLQNISVTQNTSTNTNTSHLSDNEKTPKINYLLKNSTSAPNINGIAQILNEDNNKSFEIVRKDTKAATCKEDLSSMMKKMQQKKKETSEKKSKKEIPEQKKQCYPNQNKNCNVTNISYNQVNNFINPINAVFIQNGFIVNGNIFYDNNNASYYGKFNNNFINIVPKCIRQANNYNIVQNSIYVNSAINSNYSNFYINNMNKGNFCMNNLY